MKKISRSKIDLFLNCPRCFYLDLKLGIKRPKGFPFTLNIAVDELLKREFDIYRRKGEPHPLIKHLDLIPAKNANLEAWRHNFTGVQHHDRQTDFLIFGAIDDLWIDKKGFHYVVDYKATAVKEDITELNKHWHKGYKRQAEIYQWLLRKNGLKVSNKSYFLYCNGDKTAERFNAKLNFRINLIEYTGSDTWINNCLKDMKKTLETKEIPKQGNDCEYCQYVNNFKKIECLQNQTLANK